MSAAAHGQTPQGSSRGAVQLPLAGITPTSGLELEISPDWAFYYGYRQVRVQVRRTDGARSDRQIRVKFAWRSRFNQARAAIPTETLQTVDLPAGKFDTTVVLSTPLFLETYSAAWALSVTENGAPLLDLDTPPSGFPINPSSTHAVATLGFYSPAFLNQGASLLKSWSRDNSVGVSTQPGYKSLNLPFFALFLSSPEQLSTRWNDYVGFETITLAAGELTTLQGKNPQLVEAIRRWTFGGGKLLISSAGKNWEQKDAIAKALGVSLRKVPDAVKGVNLAQADPAGESRDNSVRPAFYSELDLTYVQGKGSGNELMTLRGKFGAGDVVLISGEIHQLADTQQGAPTWQSIFGSDSATPERLGVDSQHGGNLSVAYWIPGIGEPSLPLFFTLISVFVIAIGPMNYLLLKRRRRVQWMMFTVPIIALTVALGLMTYGALADGFSTRVRVRSVTLLDQPRGLAYANARLSFYAGVAPSGLEFPADVAVLPVDDGTDHRSPLALEWVRNSDGEITKQRLSSSWVPSRTPTQLQTVRVRTLTSKLQVLEPSVAGVMPEVVNELQTSIRTLLVRTSDGKVYAADNVQPNARVKLAAVSDAEALKRYSAEVVRQKLAVHPGASSLLERELAITGLPGEIRTYVAFVENSPEVVIGMPATPEADNLNVVYGKY